ncbi:putative hydrolase [Aspergillus saccharolyticus JOP 1030-1]|uniref:Glycoside hydrolase n=1 Tax=Aspergillus saccharolyticus JOP 1030-1 TaxID=1450539 RepID=A0A318YZA4_9EURO|nr:glycoside hydrolase [Aspergillus saccharolyticus JOP 1030-1]PYH40341.1 glycoside hydrolase [Aspergillus saccharolyticus JOP 1030-1]
MLWLCTWFILLLTSQSLARGLGDTSSLASRRTAPYAVQQPPLTTDWTEQVGTNPWPEYPRPQRQRSEWKNLNGIWQYQAAASLDAVKSPPFGQNLTAEVLIPSCLESGLSGIQATSAVYSWFRTTFTIPNAWRAQNVLLNFGAVDYEATVFVNGQQAGFHRGGYFAFTVDITSFINATTNNELLVYVHDPTDRGNYVIPIGKQRLVPSHIFYTPCSGIWQSVWIESAPANYITQLDLSGDMYGQVNVTVHSASEHSTAVQIAILEDDSVIACADGTSNQPFQFHVPDPNLWSPESPDLYNVTVTLGEDMVSSYLGFRTISRGEVNGIQRPLLNGEFTFLFGTLDQGYWPDGLYSPPTREAMEYDLRVLKDLGFNMVRKHIKVEPALYYRACDELGLLVIQDMPSLRLVENIQESQQQEFVRQLDLMVNQLKNYPSILGWIIYNEGWGQITSYYPEFALTERVRQLDPTRLVDSTSGWHDHGAGDFHDNHHYANPQCGTPFYSTPSTPYDPSRIAIQGEFGGVGHNLSIEHLWNNQAAINTINQTYEMDADLDAWNARGHMLLTELQDQVRQYACSGAVWTQTTDVEGEVNGLMSYDRRVKRVDVQQWRDDIQGLFEAAAERVG